MKLKKGNSMKKARRNPPDPKTLEIVEAINNDATTEGSFLTVYRAASRYISKRDPHMAESDWRVELGLDPNTYQATEETGHIVQSIIDRLPRVFKGYKPSIRFLIYMLVVNGFNLEPSLFDAFKSYPRVETTGIQGDIISSISAALEGLCKDICFTAARLFPGLPGGSDGVSIRDVADYWSYLTDQSPFESSIATALLDKSTIDKGARRGLYPLFEIIYRPFTGTHPHHLSGMLSSLSYMYFLKTRNERLVASEIELFEQVLSGNVDAKNAFIASNRIYDPNEPDPRLDPRYAAPEEVEYITKTKSIFDKKTNSYQEIEVTVAKHEAELSDALTIYNRSASDRSSRLYDTIADYCPVAQQELPAQKQAFIESNTELFQLSIRLLLGAPFYLELNAISFTGDPALKMKGGFNNSYKVENSILPSVLQVHSLANTGSMVPVEACEPPIKLTKPTDKGLKMVASSYDPILEVFELYTNTILLNGYDSRLTLVSPFTLLLENTSKGMLAYEDFGIEETLGWAQSLLTPTGEPKQLKNTPFCLEWFNAYVSISFLSRTLNGDFFAAGNTAPAVDTQNGLVSYEDAVAIYNEEVEGINIRLKRYAAKKELYLSWEKSLSELLKDMSDLPLLLLDFKEAPPSVRQVAETYIMGWDKQMPLIQGIGYRSFFTRYYIPLFRSIGTHRIGMLASRRLIEHIILLDNASKFMSSFKLVYKDAFKAALEKRVEQLLDKSPVASKLYKGMLARKITYTEALELIQSDKGGETFNAFQGRGALAAMLAMSSLEHNLVAIDSKPDEKINLLRQNKAKSLNELFQANPQGSIPFFDTFLNLLEHIEYLQSAANDDDSEAYDTSPYMIAGLMELGFVSRDDLILLMDNFFKPVQGKHSEANIIDKSFFVVHMLEGLVATPPKGRVQPFSYPVTPTALSKELVSGIKGYLSQGLFDLVSESCMLILSAIKDCLGYTMNGCVGGELIAALKGIGPKSYQRASASRLFSALINKPANEAAKKLKLGMSGFQDLAKKPLLFGNEDAAPYGLHIASNYLKDLLKLSLCSYLISRNKASYRLLGLDTALETYLSPGNRLLGTDTLHEEENKKATGAELKSHKRELLNYELCAGNPIVTFTGEALVSSCCMSPADHGTDAVYTATLSDKTISFQLFKTSELYADGSTKEDIAFAGSCHIHSPSLIEEFLYILKMAEVIFSRTSGGIAAFSDLKLMGQIKSTGDKIFDFLSESNMQILLIIDSIERSVTAQGLFGASNTTKGITEDTYINALLNTFSKGYLYTLVGAMHSFSGDFEKSLSQMKRRDYNPCKIESGFKSGDSFLTLGLLPSIDLKKFYRNLAMSPTLGRTKSNYASADERKYSEIGYLEGSPVIPFLKTGTSYTKLDKSRILMTDLQMGPAPIGFISEGDNSLFPPLMPIASTGFLHNKKRTEKIAVFTLNNDGTDNRYVEAVDLNLFIVSKVLEKLLAKIGVGNTQELTSLLQNTDVLFSTQDEIRGLMSLSDSGASIHFDDDDDDDEN